MGWGKKISSCIPENTVTNVPWLCRFVHVMLNYKLIILQMRLAVFFFIPFLLNRGILHLFWTRELIIWIPKLYLIMNSNLCFVKLCIARWGKWILFDANFLCSLQSNSWLQCNSNDFHQSSVLSTLWKVKWKVNRSLESSLPSN